MAIPPFDENGNLPKGTWEATIEEVRERFGAYPTRRRMQFGFLMDAIAILKEVGCTTLFLDGSYVTEKILPGDFDALVLSSENGGEAITKIEEKLIHVPQKYRGEFYCAEDLAYDRYLKKTVTFLELFQTEWNNRSELIRKGIIQIQIT
jgi:hypothetical protein